MRYISRPALVRIILDVSRVVWVGGLQRQTRSVELPLVYGLAAEPLSASQGRSGLPGICRPRPILMTATLDMTIVDM